MTTAKRTAVEDAPPPDPSLPEAHAYYAELSARPMVRRGPDFLLRTAVSQPELAWMREFGSKVGPWRRARREAERNARRGIVEDQ